MGAINEHKGLHILIEAMMVARKKKSPLYLHVYGSAGISHSDQDYEDQMIRKSVGLNITFHGAVQQEEIIYAYSKNTVLCLPSALESFGLVLAEAQACGCVPVVNNTGGVKAVVKPSTAVLYQDNTGRGVFNALTEGVRTANTRRLAGVSFAHAEFGMEKTKKQLFSLLKEVAK